MTLAEVASQQIGAQQVQDLLREAMASRTARPTLSHSLVAALRCPIYLTTNYDTLFEHAWRLVNKDLPLEVVLTDSDLSMDKNVWKQYVASGTSLLLKIHGSADKEMERLILTRSDYRHHYRVNNRLFQIVRDVFAEQHILFLGFSHRDDDDDSSCPRMFATTAWFPT